MLRYSARRFVFAILTLCFASLAIFAVTEILPGDAAQISLGVNVQEDTLAAKRKALGLDRPASERYLTWVSGFVQGDLGRSYTYDKPVSELLGYRLWVSLPLALFALILSTAIALPLAFIAASARGSWRDFSVMGATQLGIAVPNFWLALLLVTAFAVQWRIFPSGGFPGWTNGWGVAFASLVLPAFALALPQASILARVMRSALLDSLSEDYMRTARAKGLSRVSALKKHGFRNALVPVLTILGLQFAFLVSGTIIIENIFYLPGVGGLVFQAIRQSDMATVQSVVLLLVAMVVALNFLIDLAYGIIDPRIRSGNEQH